MVKVFIFSLLILCISCLQSKQKREKAKNYPSEKKTLVNIKEENKKPIYLDNKSAIPFLYEYGKKNPENKVRIITKYGKIDILLYNNTEYHRANFIYLTKINYFENSMFHRVVKDFIIQAGNSDNINISKKRKKIGRYLLPPDNNKGHKHKRGVISMPSSEIDNPHKMASPYEFFIVQQSPGAYHLDGNYTAFGEVISGMDIVDKINSQPTDKKEMPLENIYLRTIIIE